MVLVVLMDLVAAGVLVVVVVVGVKSCLSSCSSFGTSMNFNPSANVLDLC